MSLLTADAAGSVSAVGLRTSIPRISVERYAPGGEGGGWYARTNGRLSH